jgi:DNA-binding transcriptional LysR family regulator
MMNIAALDLNLLIALEALLEEASVGRAAARVSLSQPAMSHALKRLRLLLRDPLLVRVGVRMQLTARGETLRDPVKDVLARARDLLVSPKFEPASSTRTFRLFLTDNAADLLLPPLLKRLQQEAPSVCIRTQPSGTGMLDHFHLARAVDVAVSCLPNSFKGYYQQRLFTDRDAVAMRRDHPLTSRLAALEEFLRARHVAVVGPEFTEDPVDAWLRQEGHTRNIALRVAQYLQALHVVAQSDLIAVIPERLIRAHAGVLDLKIVAVPLDVGTFDEYLLHPATGHADPGCKWLRQLFNEIAKSLGPLPSQRIPKITHPSRRKGYRAVHATSDPMVPLGVPTAR